ncbi:MAG: epoxyqueuosine reductase QueH, partial [Acetobacter orientalis]|uniref:epoxyqueuosine reductase QueH n=1 Tax=Acetobacter orientalis TaxID=146474 RepID=UPI0039ED5C86
MTEKPRQILTPPKGHRKVLLHSCCAPCSGEVMEAMTASGIDYTIFFYNPNIHPEREYLLRKDENIRFELPRVYRREICSVIRQRY